MTKVLVQISSMVLQRSRVHFREIPIHMWYCRAYIKLPWLV